MRSILTASIIFLLAFIQLNAQHSIGIKGGYTDAWPAYGDLLLPDNAETHVSGFNISVQYLKNLGNNFSLDIAPGFIRRGAACLPGWEPVFNGDSKNKLHYLELPIALRKTVPVFNDKTNLFISGGYGLSRLMKATIQFPADASGENFEENNIEIGNNPDARYKRYDHGAYFNLGFSYNILEHHTLFIESAYYHGMTDYDKFNVGKNRNLNFNLGYSFRLN